MYLEYSEVRSTLKTGDLLSWKAGKINSLFSVILNLYQKIFKPKSVHVGLAFVIGGRVFVVEARPPAVRIFPLSRMENFYLIRTNIAEDRANIDFLLKSVGTKYGIIDLIRGLFFAKGKYNNEQFCSEFAANYYENVGLLDGSRYKDAWRSPDNLIEAVCKITGSSPVFVRTE